MARITAISMPAASSMARVFTDAAKDTMVLAGVSAGLISFDQVRHLKGLHADQDQVGLFGGGEVVGADVDAPLRAEGDGLLGVRHGGVDLVGGKEILLEEGLQQNAAHLAGAEHRHVNVGQLRGCCVGLNGYLRHGFPCGG